MIKLDKLKNFLENDEPGIFLYTGLKDKINRKSYLFLNPIDEIICKKPEDIAKCFSKIENFLKNGFYAAGFISYETGYFLEKKLNKFIKNYDFPFLNFLIFKRPFIFNNFCLDNAVITKNDYAVYNLKSNISFKEYKKNFIKIKNLIKNGEVYQINYCFKLNFNFAGNISSFFLDLNNNQKVSYCAFIKNKNYKILSFSPELFFKIENNKIILKPMKGTLLKNDKKKSIIKTLKNEKNKAENVMIVDLIRNDLGKICKINSIKATSLFTIEEYDTLYQMTSEIKGTLKTKNIFNIIKSIFPSGSVTGAPKIRAMEILKEIEKENRFFYTGAIGFFSPEKNSVFNIPIRTIMVKNNKCEIGIGSGIVYDSKLKSEYKECLGKANFLTKLTRSFALIETLRIIKNKGYFLLPFHLKRLLKSCKFFNFKFDLKKIKKSLIKIKPDSDYKIRLLLFPDGKYKIEKLIFKENSENKIRFSEIKINLNNIFLYHKTTNRTLYNKEYKESLKDGFIDCIFLNERNEVTEGCISNIFIKKNNIFYTPPVKSGLLPGVFREYLLKKNPEIFKEKILYKTDILNADEIYICNSVMGMKKVKILV